MASKKRSKKSFRATRKFVLRVDASVRTGERTIAKVFGLPPKSVQLVLPGGRVARSDKKIRKLLKDWGW